MVMQAEIESAIETYLHVGIGENIHAGMLAILEAAELVRPKRKDNTRAERARRFRAKRNAVTGVGDQRNGVPGERNAVPCERNGVTGNVPADSGTVFFLARLPAMASTGMIMKNRPSSWATAVLVLYHMVFTFRPPNAEPLLPVDET